MIIGAICDDFTGASDLAGTLTRGGMSSTLFVGVPGGSEAVAADASVIALKTRSVPADDAVAKSLAALSWLRDQGARQIIFKYCSTFDSTPRGNIGPVSEALMNALAVDIAIVCPAFPDNGRTLFMGHLFVGDRLLSESGMEYHPVTPMTDPDIRRWLSLQVREPAAHVPQAVVARGAEAIRAALAEIASGPAPRLVVVDAISSADMASIAESIWDHRLVTGGSAVAEGLPAIYRREGLLGTEGEAFATVTGPGVVLCGSCSRASIRQVALYRQTHPSLEMRAERLIDGSMTPEAAADWVLQHIEGEPIVYSSAEPDRVVAAQERLGTVALSDRFESFFGDLARRLLRSGVRRFAVGGGETSGAVVQALELRRFVVGPEVARGVPVLVCNDPVRVGMVLKSGNFGHEAFFADALAAVGSHE